MIRTFEEIRKEDVPLAGGKGANLGEMTAGVLFTAERGAGKLLCPDRKF